MISLSFTVQLENYGALTIDNLALAGVSAGQSNPLPPPPLNQAMLGSPPTSTAAPLSGAAQAAVCVGNQWGIWFSQLRNALNPNGSGIPISFECPSLDDSDMNWGATGSIDATTDPVTLAVTPFGTSLYGRTFAVGDYVLWNEPAYVNGVAMYEICQIIAISGKQWTLQRSSSSAAGGQNAQFGSLKFAHAGKQMYRLIDKFFNVLWNGSSQTFEFGWYNKTVGAVQGTIPGLTSPTLVNLFPQMNLVFQSVNAAPVFPTLGAVVVPTPVVGGPGVGFSLQETALDPQNAPPCPGLRTLTGNQYFNTQGTAATLGLAADYWLPITGPESIRSVFGQVSVPPTGGALAVAVIYKTPDGSQAGLIETLTWQPGSRFSYGALVDGNRPDQRRQMPYHVGWPPTAQGQYDYPPSILPAAAGAIDGNGNINPAYRGASDPSEIVVFQEGGWWSFVVIQIPSGTPAPQIETVVLQT